MRLDRNLAENKGRGKYALLLLRSPRLRDDRVSEAINILYESGVLDWGEAETSSEFFVIRLKDENAHAALAAYAAKARQNGDKEWAGEVDELVERAGPFSQFCKKPD